MSFVILFSSFNTPLARAASAAQWLGESSFTASSLETGQIGYLEAWGGPYFGYSYRYSLSGAPAGVAVDTDTGMLSLQVPLSAGRYTFNAIVGNRKDGASSTFPVILDVVLGVTSHRTADQILHKTYAVDSGTWGTPDGLDYTAVLLNLRQAIVNDQAAAGDGNLRATVVFGAGKEYRYTNNRWPWGIQFLALQSDVRGTRAALRNVIRSTKHDADLYVIQSARGFYSCHQVTGNPIGDCSKAVTYWINPTTIGSNSITLKNTVDAANLRIGRYHIIGDYDQQMYGFPPNVRFFEYVKVLAVDGTTVTLDRSLRFPHNDHYYQSVEPNCLGNAHITPIDRDDLRMSQRFAVSDIEFLNNPSSIPPVSPYNVYVQGTLDSSFDNSIVPYYTVTNVRFSYFHGGAIRMGGELDKENGIISFDKTSVGELTEATGTNLVLVRDSQMGAMSVVPRQLRIIDSVANSTGDNHFTYPITIKGQSWATQEVELYGTTLRKDDGSNNPAVARWPDAKLTIGADALWNGNMLAIPSSGGARFRQFAGSMYVGGIVYSGTKANWGYITHITGDSANAYATIAWVGGSKPGAGQAISASGLHDFYMDPTSKIEGAGLVWRDTAADRQSVPSTLQSGSTRDFPAGYPASTYGF